MNYAKFLTLFICFIFPARTSAYLNLIKKTPFSYKNKCRLINSTQLAQKICFITKAKFANKTHKEIKIDVEQKRQAIKQHLYQKEEIVLQKLGTSLGFTENLWLECLETIKNLKSSTKNHPIKNSIFHDPNIPDSTLRFIKNLLIQNNLNPENINIIIQDINNPHTFAKTHSSLFFDYIPEDIHFMQNPYVTQTIILNKKLISQDIQEQLAAYSHEIEHLYQGHNIALLIIEQYTQHYMLYGKDTLNNNVYYQQLKVIHEEQAEIFAALKDPVVAQALVNFRSSKYYPHYLYVEHYNDLVEINNLWKIENTLKKNTFYKKRN